MQPIAHRLVRYLGLSMVLVVLSACGGGGGGGGGSAHFNSAAESSSSLASLSSVSSSSAVPVVSSASETSSQSSLSSSQAKVTLSGKVTYDFVPHNSTHVGLNYSAIEKRPVRGAVVELIDDSAQIVASSTTSEDGSYAFSVTKNALVRVRVKAQLFKATAPRWDFKVTDNTSGNALYVLDGALSSVGAQDSVRSLNADSGWDGAAYSAVRAGAPFSILDNIYGALNRLLEAGNTKDLRPLELRWSTKNSNAEGDAARGEIGTSYFDGSAIYILGDADHDTDEYDPHVLLHEWGHYIESQLYRADTIGGSHADGDSLDMRVAMSEGFANSFSGMMINDANYADSFGSSQRDGFFFNIGQINRLNQGFYNEGSIGSVLFNYYASAAQKTPNSYTPIHAVLSGSAYVNSDAFVSIYLFSQHLKQLYPAHIPLFDSLLVQQKILALDEYGTNESNSGGSVNTLPVYKDLSSSNSAVNVCSTAEFGKYNKLGNAQFLKISISQVGTYAIRLTKSGGAAVASKPEFILYASGSARYYVQNTLPDSASGSINLNPGNYLLEVYDANNRDDKNNDSNTTCFDVRVTPNL